MARKNKKTGKSVFYFVIGIVIAVSLHSLSNFVANFDLIMQNLIYLITITNFLIFLFIFIKTYMLHTIDKIETKINNNVIITDPTSAVENEVI